MRTGEGAHTVTVPFTVSGFVTAFATPCEALVADGPDTKGGRGMTRLVFVLFVLASIMACDHPGPTGPTGPPPVEVIRVGEQVTRRFTGFRLSFELTAPETGTLVAALTWNGATNGTVLLLQLNGTQFRPAGSVGRFPIHMTGSVQVVGGETVSIAVVGGGTDITYDDPFVLATTLE
jgi:hypothetical protein